jgi:Spx/MgsR family transcriptional regulator
MTAAASPAAATASAAPTLYGIPNCDTVRRARAWLAAQGRPASFHDFKTAGVPAPDLARWAQALGWERLLNRSGTTWRRLSDAERRAVATAGSPGDGPGDAAAALRLMQAHPSLIRRPVVQWPDGAVTVGFDEADWARRLRG